MLTGKATQATVSQTSIFLHVLQFLHVQTQLGQQNTTWTNEAVTLRFLPPFIFFFLQ